ncbi:MAG: serine/threonine protein kinase [Deltaproteobacteria bacterium]|nr:serine/threonine protein kinase [Deltaproteobacteria bacterium]
MRVQTVDPAASTVDDLAPGTLFGGYEVVRKLGTGAFGAVYEALRLPLRKRTALKVLHREFVRYPDVLKRFLSEAEIVAQMEHPHIVGVYDLGVHEGQPYIAMEFLDGETLADRLEREGVIPAAEAVDVMLAVMSAAASVHERAVVHRDLKPDNIFLARTATRSIQPKLLDFGVVKVREASGAMTMTRAMVGTPSYMSPEQAREARDVDAPSDQWSLAVILFECLTGKCPFRGDNLLDILNAITTGPIPRLREVSPTMPAGLEAVLSRAMQRDPAARWPSVRAFGEALRPFASVGGQALWEAFYTNEVAYVPTLHQWGVAPTPPPRAHLELHDVAATFAAPPPAAPMAPMPLPSPPSSPPRRGLMVAGGALFMGILLAGEPRPLLLAPSFAGRGASIAPAPAPPAAPPGDGAPSPAAAPARPSPWPCPGARFLPPTPPPPPAPPPPSLPAVQAPVVEAPASAPRQVVRDESAPVRPLPRRHPRSRASDFNTLGY